MDRRLPARAVITTVKAIVRRIFSKAKAIRTPRDDVPERRKRIRALARLRKPRKPPGTGAYQYLLLHCRSLTRIQRL